MASYGKKFATDNLNVVWAHLHAPDTAFGQSNFNVTVEITPELETQIKSAVKAAGFGKVSKINGISNRDGSRRLKVKNSQMAKKGMRSFPCVDAAAKQTQAVPFGGDVVRLILVPAYLDRDSSVSLYLEGVQIIEKNERAEGGSGFEAVEGGFDGSTASAPAPARDAMSTEPTSEDADFGVPF